jgi:PAS domain S-box-containing protein
MVDAYFDLGSSFKVLFINKSAEDLLQIPIKSVIGKSFWGIMPSLPEYKYKKGINSTFENGIPFTFISYNPECSAWLRWVFYPKDRGLAAIAINISEQVTKHAQTEISENKLRAILESVTESIIYLDTDFNILEFNSVAFERIKTTINKDLFIGGNFKDFTSADTKTSFLSSAQRAIKGEAVSREVEFNSRFGKTWFESRINPSYDNDGNIIGITVVAKNINDRKKSELELTQNEANLKKSESILKAILDNTNDSIVLMDHTYKVIAFNESIKLGLKRYFKKELVVGDDYRKYIVPSLKKTFLEAFKAATNGQTFVIESETTYKNISVWFQYKVNPVYYPNGEMLGVSLNAQNIDKRKRSELELKKNEEKFKKIIEFSAIPMLLINPNMSINMANSESKKLFGYTSQEFEKISIYDLKHIKAIQNKTSVRFEKTLTYDDLNKGIIRKMFKKNGETLLVKTSANTIDIDTVSYAILSIQNITEQVNNEIQLKKYNHELTLLNTVNDVILNTNNEHDLLKAICESIINNGNYKLAWICLIRDRDEEYIKPVAASGELKYLKGLKISLKQKELASGPTANSILHGKTTITNDVNSSKNFKPWLARAKKFGIASSCVIPLITDKKVIGTLNIYSSEINSFDKNEVSILERLGNNISLALFSLRIKEEEMHTAYQLNERVKELRTIYKINNLLKHENVSFESVIEQAIDVIPLGWKYPEICQIKITFDKKEYRSKKFIKPKSKQQSVLTTLNGKSFSLEVSYFIKKSDEYEGPFLKEERDLINTLVEMFVLNYNKRSMFLALKKSETNLRSVVNNTNVAHLLLDKNINIVAFNETMRRNNEILSGIKIKLSNNFILSLLPERREAMVKIFDEIKKSKKPHLYEVNYFHKKEPQYYTTNIVPILEKGEITGYSISVYDITKIKSLEVEREKIISDLIQRNRDLEQFSYIVSHNIRSPLATILGFGGLLKNKMPEKDLITVLQGMEDSANKLDETIRDVNEILNVKKELSQAKTIVNLNKIILNVLGSLENNIKISKAIINYDFSKSYIIHSISPYIHSIFFNLISNGIKYTQKGNVPELKIWSEKKDNLLFIYFKDNGIGIDTNKYDGQLFGLYKKFNFDVDGKGMGLFMVKTQVHALHGNIEIESKLGKGSLFKVTFPLSS